MQSTKTNGFKIQNNKSALNPLFGHLKFPDTNDNCNVFIVSDMISKTHHTAIQQSTIKAQSIIKFVNKLSAPNTNTARINLPVS